MLNKIQLRRVFEDFKITQEFGLTDFAKANPSYYPEGGHTGIDYGLPLGTPIRAAHDGFIVQDGDLDLTGKGVYVVIVDPDQLISTHYYHLRKNNVDFKSFVKAGEVIGWSGNSGLSSGPHLHFGLRIVDFNWSAIITNNTNGFINPLDDKLVEWIKL